MTVYKDQKYQEKFEASDNMIFQLKQRNQFNKGHEKMTITAVEEVSHVYIYPLLETMGFDADIFYEVKKRLASTLLGEIVRLHQHNKNMLKYFHTISKYGHLVSIPASYIQE